MTAHEIEEEMLRAEYDALIRELGPVGFIEHVQRIRPGKGDYTAERQQRPPTSFDEIRAQLRAHRAAGGGDPDIG